MQLLDPFEIDHRHDADPQIDMRRDVDIAIDHRAVQALVEQEIGVGRQVAPGRECAGRLAVRRRLGVVMQIFPCAAGSTCRIVAEQGRKLREEIGFRAEVAEIADGRR